MFFFPFKTPATRARSLNLLKTTNTFIHFNFFLLFFFSEGGRLEKELRYTHKTLGEKSGNTHEMLIQTPKDPGASLLHPGALLTHLEVVKAAISVTVNLFDL